MSNENTIPSFDDVRRKVEEYETTIMALRALCNIIIDFHQSDKQQRESRVSYGRRMDTSTSNKIHPNNNATPDAIIQIGDDWGMIVEAKRTMPKNENNRWRDTVDQMRKYDDTLHGWWTKDGLLTASNLALLVDSDRSIDFSRYIQSLINGNDIEQFQNPTGIYEFYKKQEVKQFLHIRKIWGSAEPQNLNRKMESGKSVSVEGLIEGQRFYDQEPEAVEYIMVLLWQIVFTERYLVSKFDEYSKVWLVEVELDELTEYLQNLYGNKSNEARERTYPKKKWIQKALEAFLIMGLADRTSKKDVYKIKFKKLKGVDLFQRFYKHREIAVKQRSKKGPNQPELFATSIYESE